MLNELRAVRRGGSLAFRTLGRAIAVTVAFAFIVGDVAPHQGTTITSPVTFQQTPSSQEAEPPELESEAEISEPGLSGPGVEADVAPEPDETGEPSDTFRMLRGSSSIEFPDIPKSHQFYSEIQWMIENNVTTGKNIHGEILFDPKGKLTREAMAAFMFRLYGPENYTAPAKSPFRDVAPGHQFYTEILWLYESGITTGNPVSGGIEYWPKNHISREAMAAFIQRQSKPVNYTPSQVSPFTDVKPGDDFYAEIIWMYTEGRTTGDRHDNGTRTYRPKDQLTREAGAAFLHRDAFPIENPPILLDMKTGTVAVQGTGRIGEVLTAAVNNWVPKNATFTYQWRVNGANISKATAKSYVPKPTDLNKNISVVVRASAPGYIANSVTSAQKRVLAGHVNINNFDAGNIITDAKMFDGDAMTSSEIQTFLNQKMPNCIIGTRGYERGKTVGNTKIAQDCLATARFNSHSDPANHQCKAYRGLNNETAADIIYKVGKACGVSQKALLVLLQKEQGLVGDNWPTVIQYDRAMGYGCPDTGPNYAANCDPTYVGFYEQVSWAAWQIKYYKNQPQRYRHQVGVNNTIKLHPNPGCGTATVRIANAATAGLYNYTPYVPNQAALDAGFGSGNSCSSYGNRNFFLWYSLWFGPTR